MLVHLGEDLWVNPDSIAALRPMTRQKPDLARHKVVAELYANVVLTNGITLATSGGVTPERVMALIRAQQTAEAARLRQEREISGARAVVR
jgi:hypothetical protein